MKFAPEFKVELVKALKLSLFLTVLMIGLLAAGGTKNDADRGIASQPENASGIRESTSRRAVPPFERGN